MIDGAYLRHALKRAMACALLAPALAGTFALLATLVLSLPDEPIAANILDRPDVLLSRRADNGRVIDADTECIGLSVGMSGGAPVRAGETAFARAMAPRSAYGCEPFLAFLETGDPYEIREYFRYWHGHLVVTRPALSVLAYNDLRGLTFTACVLLLGAATWRIGRDFGAAAGLAFVLPFFVLNALGYWVVATKATTFALAVGACLAFSRRGDRPAPLVAYFALGSLTAFFDFLTAPALIFCLPTIVWVMYRRRGAAAAGGADGKADRNADWRVDWRDVIALGAFWTAGYAGLWAAKIAIAAMVIGPAAWADAMGQAAFRIRGESDLVDAYWPGLALYRNVAALKSLWAPVAIGLFVAAPLIRADARAGLVSIWRRGRLPLALAAAPLAFLELLSNHAQIHAAFTHLNFAPICFLAGLALFGRTAPLLLPEGKPAKPANAVPASE
ncbi:MAG: hypothetical protein GC152_10415 [Alphaproteobacteria bacterium]|nr:hypothetical protein [Alphaproteobacteria bacterium]